MSELVNILSNRRRLCSALKDQELLYFEKLLSDLDELIVERNEVQEAQALAEKQKILLLLKKQMVDMGITLDDFNDTPDTSAKPPQTCKVKYCIEKDGEQYNWTDIGRMPKFCAEAIKGKKTIKDFAI